MCYTAGEVMGMPTAKTKAVRKYNAKNYDRIEIVVPKGQKEIIAAYAKSQGLTTNGFIVSLVMEKVNQQQE